jgi:hypothetical protein
MRTASTSRSQLPAIVNSVGSRRAGRGNEELRQMNRRVWTGVIAGVLAATVLLAVGIGSYRAGQDDEIVTRTVDNGEVVRVVEDGRGFFPGFFVFPLLLILVVVLLARGGRRHGYGHGYRGGWGPGWGPGDGYGDRGGWGPRPCGPGDRPDDDTPEARWREWHRRQHEAEAGSESYPDADADPDDRSPGAPGSESAHPTATVT